MIEDKTMGIATSMIAFSTFLGVLAAILYYFYQVIEVSFIEAIGITVTYINANLLFLLFLKRRVK